MAVKQVKSGPSIPLVRPIQKPTSQGVRDKGEQALLEHRSKGLPDNKTKYTGGAAIGSKVAGAIVLNGGVV